MKIATCACLLFAALGLSPVLAQSVPSDVRTAMIRDNEVFVISDRMEIHQLTHDAVPKALPAWSKDGTLIAFVEKADPDIALARLVVVDQHGNVVSKVLIHPKTPEEDIDSGMRFVEIVEWLDRGRIAVGGSINPSTTEYLVFELPTGRLLDQFSDDGRGDVFSTDGAHRAFVTGAPHFAAADQRLPALNVDAKPVFPSGGHVEFASPVAWSPDSKTVAVVATDYGTHKRNIVVYSVTGALNIVPMPVPARDAEEVTALYWFGGDLFLAAQTRDGQGSVTWRVARGTGSMAPVEAAVVPAFRMQQYRNSLNRFVRSSGGSEPNFWCRRCVLSDVVGRASVRE